jgi:hypothetical protein
MLVDIGLVPLQFYLHGSDDSDEVGKHQDSTRRNATQTLTETTSTVTQSLAAITMNMTQFFASMSSKMAKYNNQNIEEYQYSMDDDNRKPAAIVFPTSGNVTQPLVAITCNETQSLAATASNITQSLAATSSNVAVDDDDRNPAAVVFATADNVTHPLKATAGNKTQSLAATASNVTQSLAAMASNVAQSTVAATGNTGSELASFSPEMIAEDAATREMLLEQPPLTPQVIETLLAIFHPIVCLQLLTILPFIHRWLQMMLPLEKNGRKLPSRGNSERVCQGNSSTYSS